MNVLFLPDLSSAFIPDDNILRLEKDCYISSPDQ